MFEHILSTLKTRLNKWNVFPLTLQGKIVVANHLVLSGLWYVLTLCAIEPARLKLLQKLIVAFVWGARVERVRHKVSADILMLPKSQGGLGLLDISIQARTLGL
jgi:hypothetical protein